MIPAVQILWTLYFVYKTQLVISQEYTLKAGISGRDLGKKGTPTENDPM